MNNAVLLKISLMLGILVTLLLTPAFAQWVYYEFDTAPSVQKQYPVQMEEFNYEPQTVTLPGETEVTTPSEDPDPTPDPDPDPTPDPDPPVVPAGQNHSALLTLLTISDHSKLDINEKNSILEKNILKDKEPLFYSMKTSNSGGNSAKELANGLTSVGAEQLEFVIVSKFSGGTATEIVIYSYRALNQGTVDTTKPCEVYQVYLKYENNEWVQDKSRTYVGEAAIIKEPGNSFYIPDYNNITYK